jgi:hypothetical protein
LARRRLDARLAVGLPRARRRPRLGADASTFPTFGGFAAMFLYLPKLLTGVRDLTNFDADAASRAWRRRAGPRAACYRTGWAPSSCSSCRPPGPRRWLRGPRGHLQGDRRLPRASGSCSRSGSLGFTKCAAFGWLPPLKTGQNGKHLRFTRLDLEAWLTHERQLSRH